MHVLYQLSFYTFKDLTEKLSYQYSNYNSRHSEITLARKGIIVYIEYQSFCPFVKMSPSPSPQASVSPPYLGPGGGSTLTCGEAGGGSQFQGRDRNSGVYNIHNIIIPQRVRVWNWRMKLVMCSPMPISVEFCCANVQPTANCHLPDPPPGFCPTVKPSKHFSIFARFPGGLHQGHRVRGLD
jgi:hypothetical protein